MAAAALHNRVGFAVRRAKNEMGFVPGWVEGRDLLTKLARWTKAVSTLSNHGAESWNVDRDLKVKRRFLTKQVSDTSTRLEAEGDNDIDNDNDDTVSCATTLTWHEDGRCASKRRPRTRPNRRARKSARHDEIELLGAQLAREGERELESAVGDGSSEFIRLMRNGLEDILEDQDEDFQDEGIGAEDAELAALIGMAFGSPPHPLTEPTVCASSARKRKLVDTDLPAREAVEEEQQSKPASSASVNAHVDSSTHSVLHENTSRIHCGWSKIAKDRSEYVEVMRRALMSLRHAVQGDLIKDIESVQRLIIQLQMARRNLVEALQYCPKQGSLAARRIFDLVRETISEREAGGNYGSQPGPLEWLIELRRIVMEWNDIDDEMKGYELRDINSDAEQHAHLIEYILDSIEQFLEEEDE